MRNASVLICASIILLMFTAPVMAETVKMKDNPR
jgi:hypothetical protein